MSTSFGPTAIATPANVVTVGRMIATPFVLGAIAGDHASWGALGLWILFAGTDGVDGWLARKHGTTRSGAFLDPLADKLLVIGAMGVLVAIDVFWWVPVAVIAVREVAMSVYRSMASRGGVSIPARSLAKAKTVTQAVAVGFALLPPLEDDNRIAETVLWVAVVLTVVTGIQYLVDGRRAAHAV
jgi:CDP-diacylglycerol---glycerol-3-phosphate 3-phosphatidyltransferase